ncbi:MAG: hypothetical protein MK008_14400 [Bdellovibrionales bacterium]|nr:hypothetical protein [Bdellovibrionales bacterium]
MFILSIVVFKIGNVNIVGFVLSAFVSVIFYSGILRIVDRVFKKEGVKYKDLFYYLNNIEELKPLLPFAYASIMINAPLILTQTLFDHLNFNKNVESIFIIVLSLITTLASYLIFLSLPQMIFKKVHIIESIKNNIKAIVKNFKAVIGYGIFIVLLAIFSSLLLVLPFIFIALPIIYISPYFAYITIFEEYKIEDKKIEIENV